jgi:hypothetical protein
MHTALGIYDPNRKVIRQHGQSHTTPASFSRHCQRLRSRLQTDHDGPPAYDDPSKFGGA